MAIQKEKIKAVIAKDATLRYRYFDPATGDMCIIGGLLNEAGFDMMRFMEKNPEGQPCWGLRIGSLPEQLNEEVLRILSEEYGLQEENAVMMQNINDNMHVNTDKRREKLTSFIEGGSVSTFAGMARLKE